MLFYYEIRTRLVTVQNNGSVLAHRVSACNIHITLTRNQHAAVLLQLFLRYDGACELAKAGVQSVDHCKYAIVISDIPAAVPSLSVRSIQLNLRARFIEELAVGLPYHLFIYDN